MLLLGYVNHIRQAAPPAVLLVVQMITYDNTVITVSKIYPKSFKGSIKQKAQVCYHCDYEISTVYDLAECED